MIRAVIFDWGGVLIENPLEGLVDYCAAALGVSREAITASFGKYQNDFHKGLLAEADLWLGLCRDLNVPVPAPRQPTLYRQAVEHVFVARPEVFRLAKALRERGYKTGFLSNTEIPAMEYFLGQGYDMFDVTVFSCAEHTAKPEAEIYRIACDRLGVEFDEAVFIDDRPDYIQGAARLGMRTILYETFEQVTRDLQALGVRG
jgi:putative hydrolase of the HAD superfamily